MTEDRRVVSYLRLSVTDRCNLRCRYCMPEEGIRLLPHGEILSYAELEEILAAVAPPLGLRGIRVTGGEPLVRGAIVHGHVPAGAGQPERDRAPDAPPGARHQRNRLPLCRWFIHDGLFTKVYLLSCMLRPRQKIT